MTVRRTPKRATLLALVLTGAATVASAQTVPAGRLLASNCFQCHGTNGRGPGFDQIAGESAAEMFEKLKEFQSGKEGDGIMAKHARGFTDAQIRQLAEWLSKQR
ncbi:MAG: c-type cytochrome [Rubrivivax sp.]|nr:c-type cytochrome [Rubrivivax sp.]